jgi:hypothetical protein
MLINKKSYKNSNIKNKRRSKINGGKPPKETMTIFVNFFNCPQFLDDSLFPERGGRRRNDDKDIRKLEVESSDTIDMVKAKIQDLGIHHTFRMFEFDEEEEADDYSIKDKILIFNDNELEGGRTLASYNIQNGSILHIDYDYPVYQVSVKTVDGNTISLDVKSKYTIGMLKAQIQDKAGIPTDPQRLFFYRELADHRTLHEYSIDNGSIIHLVVTPPGHFVLTVLMDDGTSSFFTIDVKNTDTIGQVKDKIQHERGIPTVKQVLMVRGWSSSVSRSPRMKLEDGKTLQDYITFIHAERNIRLKVTD